MNYSWINFLQSLLAWSGIVLGGGSGLKVIRAFRLQDMIDLYRFRLTLIPGRIAHKHVDPTCTKPTVLRCYNSADDILHASKRLTACCSSHT